MCRDVFCHQGIYVDRAVTQEYLPPRSKGVIRGDTLKSNVPPTFGRIRNQQR